MLALALAAVAPLALGQTAEESELRVEVEVRREPPLDLGRVAEALESPDLAVREAAFDTVLERALCDEALQKWLARAAAATERTELAWSARLILREIECRGERPAVASAPRMLRFAVPTIDEAWLAQMNAVQQKARQLIGTSDLGLILAMPGRKPESQPRRVYARAEPNSRPTHEDVDLLQDPEGRVHATVRRREGGELVTERFESDSMGSLLAEHPELAAKLNIPVAPGQRFLTRPETFALGSIQRTDDLGARVGPVTAERVVELGLEAGEGQEVVHVYPGSIARAVGLRPGDVILSVRGVLLRGAADITRALAERPEGGAVEVAWINRRGRREVRTWTPLAPTSPEPNAKPTESSD